MLDFDQLKNLLNDNDNDDYFKDYLKGFCSHQCHNKKVRIYLETEDEGLLANYCSDCVKLTDWKVRPLNDQEIFTLKILLDTN